MPSGKFEIDFLAEYSDEALLDELRRIAMLVPIGEPLTAARFKEFNPKVSRNTIRRRFGGWNEALNRAGLGHLYSGQPVSQKMRRQSGRGLSREALIAEMRRVYAVVGKQWLTTADFNAHSTASRDAIRSRFGSFSKGLEAAGIQPHPAKNQNFTGEQCFENIASVWVHFGRAPKYREMFEPPSTIQGKTYVIRWGTWRKTLKAFVDWANSEGESEKSVESDPGPDQAIPETRRVDPPLRNEADCREIRPGLRFKVFMRDRFRCVTCGRSPATHLDVDLHADHVLAVANGGKTTFENLQTLCQTCNLGKGRTILT